MLLVFTFSYDRDITVGIVNHVVIIFIGFFCVFSIDIEN